MDYDIPTPVQFVGEDIVGEAITEILTQLKSKRKAELLISDTNKYHCDVRKWDEYVAVFAAQHFVKKGWYAYHFYGNTEHEVCVEPTEDPFHAYQKCIQRIYKN
jgi:hypothetical protein